MSLTRDDPNLGFVDVAERFRAGVNISHAGSGGLEGAVLEGVVETGESNIKVELSQSVPIRGEYAGVDGSESMNVLKDFADIGGDIGDFNDIGVMGGELNTGDRGDPKVEKRCGRMLPPGDLGTLGMPWLVNGTNPLPRLVPTLDGEPGRDDWVDNKAESMMEDLNSATTVISRRTKL